MKFAFLQGLEARKAERYKWGAYYKLEVYCGTFCQKTFPGRIDVKCAQNAKATKKNTKKAQTLFFQADEGYEKAKEKIVSIGTRTLLTNQKF